MWTAMISDDYIIIVDLKTKRGRDPKKTHKCYYMRLVLFKNIQRKTTRLWW